MTLESGPKANLFITIDCPSDDERGDNRKQGKRVEAKSDGSLMIATALISSWLIISESDACLTSNSTTTVGTFRTGDFLVLPGK